MNRDGYVRLRSEGPLLGEEPRGIAPILFVDLEPGATTESLRRVPHTYMALVRVVLVRGSDKEAAKLRQVLEDVGRRIPCLRLEHGVGKPAVVVDDAKGAAAVEPPDLPTRARTAELRSLLELGEAVWEASRFHFLLPSGRHARAFIRPSQAIRTLRDASVIAEWLLAHIDPSGSGVVIDSPTLIPVLQALVGVARQRSVELGAVQVLDGYPSTKVDAWNAVQTVAERTGNVLALISVSGTGTVSNRVAAAAHDLGSRVKRAEIVSIVDIREAAQPIVGEKIAISALVHLGDPKSQSRFESYDGACALCDKAETAPLVPVDVSNFDVRFPSFVEREMPSIRDPQKNRDLWEACHRTSAILFESEPDLPVRVWRATERMTWRVDWNELLKDESLAQRTRLRIEQEVAEQARAATAAGRDPGSWTKFDLILVPERDLNRVGFKKFWAKLNPLLSAKKRRLRAFPDNGEWKGDLLNDVKAAKRLLVFSLGTVTGTTLQRALNEIQRTREDSRYELYGLVIHARPSRSRTWDVLRNSYSRRLLAAYLSFVPDEFSPLGHEARFLSHVDTKQLDPPAVHFLEHRGAVCKGESGHPEWGFLWGSAPEPPISPHSIFGERLGSRATLVAVGSAIHARRESERRPPYRILFEMQAIAKSYYDPVIFACMLRWLRPAEIWWGDSLTNAETVVQEVLARAVDGQKPMLLGELLLACAQGKLPPRAANVVIAQAEAFRGAPPGLLELGLLMARQD